MKQTEVVVAKTVGDSNAWSH